MKHANVAWEITNYELRIGLHLLYKYLTKNKSESYFLTIAYMFY